MEGSFHGEKDASPHEAAACGDGQWLGTRRVAWAVSLGFRITARFLLAFPAGTPASPAGKAAARVCTMNSTTGRDRRLRHKQLAQSGSICQHCLHVLLRGAKPRGAGAPGTPSQGSATCQLRQRPEAGLDSRRRVTVLQAVCWHLCNDAPRPASCGQARGSLQGSVLFVQSPESLPQLLAFSGDGGPAPSSALHPPLVPAPAAAPRLSRTGAWWEAAACTPFSSVLPQTAFSPLLKAALKQGLAGVSSSAYCSA